MAGSNGVTIPIRLATAEAKRDAEDVRKAVRAIGEDAAKQGSALSQVVSLAAKVAGGAAVGQAAGAGAFAFGASGGNSQTAGIAAARAIQGSLGNTAAAIGAAAGASFGPAGAALGGLVGKVTGEVGAGILSRSIDEIENPLNAAKDRVAGAAAAAGRLGIKFSDDALQKALDYRYQVEKRGFAESRRVFDLKATVLR